MLRTTRATYKKLEKDNPALAAAPAAGSNGRKRKRADGCNADRQDSSESDSSLDHTTGSDDGKDSSEDEDEMEDEEVQYAHPLA